MCCFGFISPIADLYLTEWGFFVCLFIFLIWETHFESLKLNATEMDSILTDSRLWELFSLEMLFLRKILFQTLKAVLKLLISMTILFLSLYSVIMSLIQARQCREHSYSWYRGARKIFYKFCFCHLLSIAVSKTMYLSLLIS